MQTYYNLSSCCKDEDPLAVAGMNTQERFYFDSEIHRFLYATPLIASDSKEKVEFFSHNMSFSDSHKFQ
jgi:hypothetical protein